MATVRVVVATDDMLVRNLVRLVCTDPSVIVVGEASDLATLVDLARAEQPNVVVAAPSFPDGELLDVVGAVSAGGANVLVLHDDPCAETQTGLLATGAVGYVLHDTEPEQLRDAIKAAAEGESPLHPRVAATLLQQWRRLRGGDGLGATRPRPSKLTSREIDVLAAMVDGLSTKGIARHLGVAVKTVENHKIRIFDKLGVRSQAQAVSFTIHHGLLAPVGETGGGAAHVIDLRAAAGAAGREA